MHPLHQPPYPPLPTDLLYKPCHDLHTSDRNSAWVTQFSVLHIKCPAPLDLVFVTGYPFNISVHSTPCAPSVPSDTLFQWPGGIGCVRSISPFRGENGPPLRHIRILATHHLNDHSPLTQWVPATLTINVFNTRPILSAGRSDFGLTGEYPCPPSIFCSRPATTATTLSNSTHRSPPCSPPTVLMPDQYWVRGTRILVWQGNIPASRQSFASGLPPPQPLRQTQPTGFLHASRQPFSCQTNIECGALRFWFGGGIFPPPIDPLLLACHHRNHSVKLNPQVASMLPANRFDARPILNAGHSDSGLAGEYSRPLSIFCSRPATTATTPSNSTHRSPPCSPPTVLMPDRYWVRGTRILVWQGNIPAPCRSFAPRDRKSVV